MSRHFLRPRRKAAESAIGILFGDTSDDEPQNVDEEDEEFILQDNGEGVEETIIIDPDGDILDSNSADANDQVDFYHHWDAMTPLFPPALFPLPEVELLNELSPYDAFLFVSKLEKLIEDVIIPQSELYAQQMGVQYRTNPEEIKVFLGITILLGYHRLPSMRDYWAIDADLAVPFVANIMSRDRFELVRRMLHFTDNVQENLDEDRAYKVRPFDHIIQES